MVFSVTENAEELLVVLLVLFVSQLKFVNDGRVELSEREVVDLSGLLRAERAPFRGAGENGVGLEDMLMESSELGQGHFDLRLIFDKSGRQNVVDDVENTLLVEFGTAVAFNRRTQEHLLGVRLVPASEHVGSEDVAIALENLWRSLLFWLCFVALGECRAEEHQ